MIDQVACPAPRDEWNEIARSDPDALIEHSPAWTAALEATGRVRDVSRLYRMSDGRRFVLPLIRRTPFPGPQRSFGSGFGIGGPVGAGLDPEAISVIIKDLSTDRSIFTHIRPNPLHGDIWAAADTVPAKAIPRRSHVVDLSGGAEEVWKRFRKSGRTGVKRAEQYGVRVTSHVGGENLDVYYEQLYLRSIERWAARQKEPLALSRLRSQRRDPLKRLVGIAQSLGSSFTLYLAWIDDKPAAGIVVVQGDNNAHTNRGALNYDLARESSATYALEWAALQDACAADSRWFQMGESGQNESLSEYKERFGAVAYDYHEYRIERIPVLAADNLLRSSVKRIIGFEDQ